MEKKEFVLKNGRYFRMLDRDEIPFFNELIKYEYPIEINDIKYEVFTSPSNKITKEIDKLIKNRSIRCIYDFYLLQKESEMEMQR